jgi:aminotransferase
MPNATATLDNLRLSELAPHLIQSEIRSMTAACSVAGGINMAQGVCDTDPPHPVVEAAIDAIRSGHNIYTAMEGITLLRDSIAQKFARFNHLHVDPTTQVLVTSGATGAMYSSLMALLNAGDECLVLEPFYGYHVSTLRTLRIKPVVVPLAAPTFALDLNQLRSAVTTHTRAIILNSPSNPSGKVFTLAELELLADFAIEHDLFVFTDEMYEHFVYDGAQALSIATLPGMADRTITISGFSKTFSVTGWRLGYLTASPRWIPAVAYFHDLVYICAPSPLQYGAAAGLLQLPESFYTRLTAEYQAKRDKTCAALTQAGLTPQVPTGAYYVLADATHIPGTTAPQKARRLLADTGVASVAGSAFFQTRPDGTNPGDNLLRFCFAKKSADLTEACRRLEAYNS